AIEHAHAACRHHHLQPLFSEGKLLQQPLTLDLSLFATGDVEEDSVKILRPAALVMVTASDGAHPTGIVIVIARVHGAIFDIVIFTLLYAAFDRASHALAVVGMDGGIELLP